MSKVSIILPTYKKEKVVQKVINSICDVMDRSRWDYEVIVILDGINDNTADRVKNLKNSKVVVYGYSNNKGKGYAVRYGMARASGDPIIFMDCTTKINPKGLTLILEHMDWYKADVVVASKRHPASRVSYSLTRKIYSMGYQLLILFLFRLKVKDTQVGLKAYRRDVLEKVLPRLLIKQYAFDVELLAVAKYLGFRKIYGAPVELDFSAEESVGFQNKFLFANPFIRNMLVDTFAIFYRMYLRGYYHSRNTHRWIHDEDLQMQVSKNE